MKEIKLGIGIEDPKECCVGDFQTCCGDKDVPQNIGALKTEKNGAKCECGGSAAEPFAPLNSEEGCGCGSANTTGLSGNMHILPMAGIREADDEPCCGPPQALPASHYEKAGYRLCHYVEGFKETVIGSVPRVATKLGFRDHMGTVRARMGFLRDVYQVAPGLYCAGDPDADAPVMVTANYKLTFDALRQELSGVDVWILVLDTRGVNVWCAAAKKNFSTKEIIKRVRISQLDKVVSHRRLLLPQLAAPGVSAHKVKSGCGFAVKYGPIRASDIKEYLANDNKASAVMRRVTFTMLERMILVPVEIYLIIKPTLWIIFAIFLISGIGPKIFALTDAWSRGGDAIFAYFAGVLGGAVAVPLLLPWLPSRKFYVKGIITGLLAGWWAVHTLAVGFVWEAIALILLSMVVSSYAAMNFTGTTPFTSPTGVEKEMRQAIPFQAISAVGAVIVWVIAPFIK